MFNADGTAIHEDGGSGLSFTLGAVVASGASWDRDVLTRRINTTASRTSPPNLAVTHLTMDKSLLSSAVADTSSSVFRIGYHAEGTTTGSGSDFVLFGVALWQRALSDAEWTAVCRWFQVAGA
jgi:hypothetical protein